MAEGQRQFATQRAGYEANFAIYPTPPGQPTPMRKSESALSLSVSQPLPEQLQQRRGTICTSELIRVESNTAMPSMPGRGPPPMAGQFMRPSCMAPSFAEPRSTRRNYGPCPRYGRPYSPPPSPPPGAQRTASGRRSSVRRHRRAYDEDYYDGRCGNRGHDDGDDGDDDFEYAEHSRRQVPSARRSRSRKDAAEPACSKSTMSRSGSRLRILRIERDISDTGLAPQGASSKTASPAHLDKVPVQRDDVKQPHLEPAGSCVCICGPSRSPPRRPSRGPVSGIYIKSQHEEDAEELYVIRRIRDKKGKKKKRRKKPPPPPPPAPPAQPGLMGYLCNLVGMGNEAQTSPPPPPPVPATDSDTDDGDEYELARLDRAELERLCLEMGIRRNADAPGKK